MIVIDQNVIEFKQKKNAFFTSLGIQNMYNSINIYL